MDRTAARWFPPQDREIISEVNAVTAEIKRLDFDLGA